MHIHVASVFRSFFCKRKLLLLALCCCLGFFCGMIAAHRSDDTYFSMMRMAFTSHVSISGLIASVSLPFLFSAFAVYAGHSGLLYGLCFVKLFFFGLSSAAVHFAFGSAGWLVRLLLCFSDCCAVPVLCWFCIRSISGNSRHLIRDFAVCAAWIATVVAIDICVISPFLASLIDY